MNLLIQKMGSSKQEEYRFDVHRRFKKVEGFCSKNRENLKTKAIQTLEGRGCQVFLAANAEKVANIIAEIVQSGRIVISKDPLLEALGLPEKLLERGVITICTNEERFVPGKINEARVLVRKEIVSATFGLTGVQAVVANHGSLVLMDEQGSIHSISALPFTHIAVASVQQIVPDLVEAMTVVRFASLERTVRKLMRYISIITGPSSTSDIEGKNVRGMHGPQEVYVILVE